MQVVRILIECINLPPSNWDGHAAISVGIQQGKEVVQGAQLPAESVSFEAELRVGNEPTDERPNFLGPFAFGTPQERFLYVCWGEIGLGGWRGFRRAKLPLNGLGWEDIQSPIIRAQLNCTDAKGGPICATVKPTHLVWSSAQPE